MKDILPRINKIVDKNIRKKVIENDIYPRFKKLRTKRSRYPVKIIIDLPMD